MNAPNEFFIGIAGEANTKPMPLVGEVSASRHKQDIIDFLAGFGGADIIGFKVKFQKTKEGKLILTGEEWQ